MSSAVEDAVCARVAAVEARRVRERAERRERAVRRAYGVEARHRAKLAYLAAREVTPDADADAAH